MRRPGVLKKRMDDTQDRSEDAIVKQGFPYARVRIDLKKLAGHACYLNAHSPARP